MNKASSWNSHKYFYRRITRSKEIFTEDYIGILTMMGVQEVIGEKDDIQLQLVWSWFEMTTQIDWSIFINNLAADTIDLICPYPSLNSIMGKMVFMTRTRDIAEKVATTRGKMDHTMELRQLDAEKSARFLMIGAYKTWRKLRVNWGPVWLHALPRWWHGFTMQCGWIDDGM